MSITVKEKEHWKERIAQKIERAITELLEKSDPRYMEQVSLQAREKAIEALGGTQLLSDLNALSEQEDAVQKEIENTQQKLADLAKRVGIKPVARYYGSRDNIETWEKAVATRQAISERELLSKDALGQQVLKLRGEQEALLDTVWLSTSPLQIRELWKNVTELVSGELPELQKKVLSTSPPSGHAKGTSDQSGSRD